MSVTEIDWLWFSGFGNGYQTVDMNMSPDSIVAQIWLHGAGPDSAYAGIKHYLQRLPASPPPCSRPTSAARLEPMSSMISANGYLGRPSSSMS